MLFLQDTYPELFKKRNKSIRQNRKVIPRKESFNRESGDLFILPFDETMRIMEEDYSLKMCFEFDYALLLDNCHPVETKMLKVPSVLSGPKLDEFFVAYHNILCDFADFKKVNLAEHPSHDFFFKLATKTMFFVVKIPS